VAEDLVEKDGQLRCYVRGRREQRTRRREPETTGGFQVVSPLDAEPAATRQRGEERGRARTGSRRGASLNKLDNQTAVHEREPYTLYRKMRNKLIKRETTEEGGQEERETGYMCNDEQIRRQGRKEVLSDGSMKKGRKQERKGAVMRRKGVVMGGAAKHVLTGPRLRWRQWRASHGERCEKRHALPRAGRRYGVGTCACRDGDSAEARGPGEGAGMNRIKSEITTGLLRS
jgi:hypothetical protein